MLNRLRRLRRRRFAGEIRYVPQEVHNACKRCKHPKEQESPYCVFNHLPETRKRVAEYNALYQYIDRLERDVDFLLSEYSDKLVICRHISTGGDNGNSTQYLERFTFYETPSHYPYLLPQHDVEKDVVNRFRAIARKYGVSLKEEDNSEHLAGFGRYRGIYDTVLPLDTIRYHMSLRANNCYDYRKRHRHYGMHARRDRRTHTQARHDHRYYERYNRLRDDIYCDDSSSSCGSCGSY
jgi:hypothetical protein